jgi:hypothetical protein
LAIRKLSISPSTKNMENRIDRKNDENLYQPQIHSDRIRELHHLKLETGIPITVLADQAIREFVASYGVKSPLGEEPNLAQVDQETWEEIFEYRQFLDQLEYQRCLDELEEIMSKDKERVSDMTEQELVRGDNEMLNTIYQAK